MTSEYVTKVMAFESCLDTVRAVDPKDHFRSTLSGNQASRVQQATTVYDANGYARIHRLETKLAWGHSQIT